MRRSPCENLNYGAYDGPGSPGAASPFESPAAAAAAGLTWPVAAAAADAAAAAAALEDFPAWGVAGDPAEVDKILGGMTGGPVPPWAPGM